MLVCFAFMICLYVDYLYCAVFLRGVCYVIDCLCCWWIILFHCVLLCLCWLNLYVIVFVFDCTVMLGLCFWLLVVLLCGVVCCWLIVVDDVCCVSVCDGWSLCLFYLARWYSFVCWVLCIMDVVELALHSVCVVSLMCCVMLHWYCVGDGLMLDVWWCMCVCVVCCVCLWWLYCCYVGLPVMWLVCLMLI